MILPWASLFLMGGVLGLLGGGGSILTVPILVYLFDYSVKDATGLSLLVVGLSALFALYSYYQRNLVNFRIGTLFAIPSFFGVYLARVFIVPHLADTFIMILFSALMLMAAFSMIKKTKASDSNLKSPNFILVLGEGLLVGALTGVVGAGGGFLIIPALILLVGLDTKMAIGTSLMIIAFKSLFGFLGELQTGISYDYGFVGLMIVLSFVGVALGAQVSKKIDSPQLKPIFGYFILLMGGVLLYQQI